MDGAARRPYQQNVNGQNYCAAHVNSGRKSCGRFYNRNNSESALRRSATLGAEWDARVRQLVADWGADKTPELIEEMIVTALKIGRDQMGVADLKLINRSLKELRYAAKVFAPYTQIRKIAVFGSARTPVDAIPFAMAEQFGREIIKHNFMVITGGGDGIMGAAQRGAGREIASA